MSVRIGDRGCIQSYGKGSINDVMFDGKNWNQNHLIDVLYVSKLKYNLFSFGAVMDKSVEMRSTNATYELIKEGRIIAIGVRQGKIYVMQFETTERNRAKPKRDSLQAFLASTGTLKGWHEKLAHQNFRHVRQILDSDSK